MAFSNTNLTTFDEIKLMMLSAIVFEKKGWMNSNEYLHPQHAKLLDEIKGWNDYNEFHTKIFGRIIDNYQKTKTPQFNLKDILNEKELSDDQIKETIILFIAKDLLTKSRSTDFKLTKECQELIKKAIDQYHKFEEGF